MYIFAMSERQKEIRRRLVDRCEMVDRHLIKILLFSNSQDVNHWKGEVYSFLNNVSRQKKGNKFPSYRFIREALSVNEDILENIVRQIESENRNLEPQRYTTDIIEMVILYHDWLAENLSEFGLVLKEDVYSEIDKLLAM